MRVVFRLKPPAAPTPEDMQVEPPTVVKTESDGAMDSAPEAVSSVSGYEESSDDCHPPSAKRRKLSPRRDRDESMSPVRRVKTETLCDLPSAPALTLSSGVTVKSEPTSSPGIYFVCSLIVVLQRNKGTSEDANHRTVSQKSNTFVSSK